MCVKGNIFIFYFIYFLMRGSNTAVISVTIVFISIVTTFYQECLDKQTKANRGNY